MKLKISTRFMETSRKLDVTSSLTGKGKEGNAYKAKKSHPNLLLSSGFPSNQTNTWVSCGNGNSTTQKKFQFSENFISDS